MKVSTRSRIYLAATALGVVLSTPAFAQSEGNASDIVVTARRVEERLQDVPISITVFNQDQIDDRNITTATDLAFYTPSLTANSRFGADKASFTIRGFNQDGKTAPTVGVYFAEVVSVRANSGTGGGNGAGPGSFFDLQNVQVLKGPQGTLFGRNTTGGAILLVPQRPTGDLEGYVEGSAGNYNLLRAQGVLNIPLADTFKVRLGIDRQKRDGYLRNQSGIGPKDFADIDYLAARLSILAELTPDLENYTIASYSRSDTNGPMFKIGACERNPALRTGRGVFAGPLACAQVDRQAARGDGFYDVENAFATPQSLLEQWQVINATTWKASDTLTIKNIMSFGEYRERYAGNIGGEFLVQTTGPLAGLPLSTTLTAPFPHAFSNFQSAFTEEFQIQGNSSDNRLKYQLGAYFEQTKPNGSGDTTLSGAFVNCTDVFAYRCAGVSTALSGLGLIYNQIQNRNIGLYAQGTYEFTDKLAMTAGVRYTMDRMEGHGGRLSLLFGQPNIVTATSCSNPRFVPTPGNLNPRQCDSGPLVTKSEKPTWVVDLEYKPISDVMVYAKYSRGYRQGGVDPSVISLEFWSPEKVDTYELGGKTSFSSGSVRGYFNFAAFYNDFRNQQLSITFTGKAGSGITGARAIINAGKSRLWGIEADASVTLFDSLKLDAGYTYLNTELQEISVPAIPVTSPYNPPNIAIRTGGDLPFSPHHRLTLGATYTLPLDESIGRVSLGANYVYTSTQLGVLEPIPFQKLPSSNLLNANINWDKFAGLPVDLSFFVTNLTKEKFPVAVGNSWASGYESFIPNVPRMWGFRLKYRFGN